MWKARNSWCFNKEYWEEKDIIQRAWDEWLEFSQENPSKTLKKEEQKQARRPSTNMIPRWDPPEAGVIKLNVSSSSAITDGNAGIGILARDEKGMMIQAWTVLKTSICHVAEIEGVRMAQIVAMQNGWNQIEVQVDIQAIKDSLLAKVSPVPQASSIAEDVFLLELMFETCIFSYCHKSVNRASSSLARLAFNSKTSLSWKQDFPQWLREEAAIDV